MGDGGELQGTKLTTSQGPVTLDGGSSGPPPAHIDPSERDPGRRIEDIQAIIQTHRPDAQACYESALKNHPGIAGYLDVTWKLDPKGNVVETGVDDAKSQIHDDALVKCVGNVIRGIKWAPSPRGVETTTHYPFNFHHH
jgi:hypothetical protein